MDSSPPSAPPPPLAGKTPAWIERGTPAYARAGFALFLAGFSTFALLYCVQPLLPEFARDYRVSPGESSLALSLTTGFLALAILVAGALSQGLPRRGLMFGSMAAAAVLNLGAAAAPNWPLLLVARALEGFLLGGVPAVAMAYLAEEVHPRNLGKSMGLYVAGTAFGGMMGRVGMGLLTEIASWQAAMAILGGLCLLAAVGFLVLLPPSRNFTVRRGLGARHHLRTWAELLARPALLRILLIAFCVMSVFVTIFNYAGFRLSAPPYALGQTAIAMIFLAYGFGIFASSAAGSLADRFGRRSLLLAGLGLMAAGVATTLAGSLALVILGIVLVTIGFFAAHAVASGWVGPLAGPAKGHAASLYLLFYYAGSSISGSAAGWVWEHGGWGAVAGFCFAFAAAGFGLAARMRELHA